MKAQDLQAKMSDGELFSKVKAVVNTLKDKSFEAIIKAAVVAINGQADGKRISVAVKKDLETIWQGGKRSPDNAIRATVC
jgi:uncharacterized protein YqeY